MTGRDYCDHSGSDQPSTGVAGGRGNIRAVRGGINPNSSGHGVLWASLLFLPHALMSTLLQVMMSDPLDQALQRYRLEQNPGRVRSTGLVAVSWALVWALSAAAWIALLSLRMFGWPLYALLAAGGISVSGLACLGYARRSAGSLRLAIWHSLRFSAWLLPVLALSLLAGAEATDLLLLLAVAGPLPALLLTGSLLKVYSGWSTGRVIGATLVYAIGGALLLIPWPYSYGGYNPIGLFFPIWGFIGPAAVAAWLLWDSRRQREGCHARPKDQV